MGKVDSLNRDIRKLEEKITVLEGDLRLAGEDLANKAITRAQYTAIKQKNQIRIKGLRTSIGKKEKARMLFEKKIKEKEEKRVDKERKKGRS